MRSSVILLLGTVNAILPGTSDDIQVQSLDYEDYDWDDPPSFPKNVEDVLEDLARRDSHDLIPEMYPEAEGAPRPIESTGMGPFIVGNLIGHGSAGSAYETVPVETRMQGGSPFVIKYVTSAKTIHPLVREFAVLDYLADADVTVPPLYLSPPSFDDRFQTRYLIMGMAGPSIEQFRLSKYPESLMLLHELLYLGISVITLLEKLHSKGLVHSDLNSGNIVFRNPGSYTEICQQSLLLIDFEYARLPDESRSFKGDLIETVDMLVDINFQIEALFPSRQAEPTDADRDIFEPYNLSQDAVMQVRAALINFDMHLSTMPENGIPDYNILISHLTMALNILS